jgi:serine/threonine-protein kinase
MPDERKSGPTRPSGSAFLAALERSGILAEPKLREVQDRHVPRARVKDSLVLAHQLIDDGTLTEFQARWLLRGRKGLTVGRYVLLDHIGQGARGRVFKARHSLMDRVVALKVLSPDGALSEMATSRFFREMKIVGLLDHPNVVRAIDADVHEGCPYIVMEFLEGDDMEHILARRGPLPADDVVAYMAQLSRGLAHAHAKGVIHRDVKPTNVFLANSGHVKLLDLGFGEFAGMPGQEGNVFDTDENIVVGTTDFMSPEQVRCRPVDTRTDLFSLGCTMYRLLTGEYAYPGITREDRLIKRIRQPSVPIVDVRSGLSDELVAIVDRLLATRPADRFGSADETADALEALVAPDAQTVQPKSTKPGSNRPRATVSAVTAEPEKPLDWSVIESALRPNGRGDRESARLLNTPKPTSPSTKRLSSHRKTIEEQGSESGREAHQKYRNELIQMKRAMAELRATDPKDESPAEGPNLFERIGEKVGDFLVEPSAAHLLIGLLGVLLVLAMAMAFALG